MWPTAAKKKISGGGLAAPEPPPRKSCQLASGFAFSWGSGRPAKLADPNVVFPCPGRPEKHDQRSSIVLLCLNRLRQPVDQLLLLGVGQLGIGMQQRIIARRHLAARNLALD